MSEGRAKRTVSASKSKKLEALSRLRSLHGAKHKYEVEEEVAVYEEVDEIKYAELVSKRQREDWIVDDDGSGYADHGREIFDDEYDEDESYFADDGSGAGNRSFSKSSSTKRNKYSLKSKQDTDSGKGKDKGDIRNVFASMKRNANLSASGKMKNPFHSSSMLNSKKSLNEVKIDDAEIDNLVEAIITPKPIKTTTGTSTGQALLSTPQGLKLQKKTTVTQGGSSTPSSVSTLKRKSFTSTISPIDSTSGLLPVSTSSNMFGMPPLKRRVLTKKEFNFDDIIDDQEVMKEVQADSSFSKSKSTFDNGVKVKQELPDSDDDDFMLPDNTADDIDDNMNSDIKPNLKILQEVQLNDLNKLKSGDPIRGKLDNEEWISTGNNMTQESINGGNTTCAILPKEIPFEVDDEGNKFIKFYWFDAFNDPHRSSDNVYLFGKVWVKEIDKYVSCAVIVKNVHRRIFLLPREHIDDDKHQPVVSIQDVHDEFEQTVAPQLKVKSFLSRKVSKRYSFELANIPTEADYLEIHYPASCPPLPDHLCTGHTYRHVFGAQASVLENMIMDLNLMGPQWLLIRNPVISEQSISWCKMELTVEKQSQLSVLKPEDKTAITNDTNITTESLATPDFTVLSLALKTFTNPETKQNEIVAVSCLVNRSFNFDGNSSKSLKSANSSTTLPATNMKKYDSHFCIITKPSAKCGVELPIDFTPKMALKDYHKTTINRMNSERELLNFFLARFHQIDPDIIVGHDLFAFDYELLLSRFSHYKIQSLWSKLGRIKRSGLPLRTKDKHLLTGRLICDIKILARELIRAKSYDLTELAAQILKKGRFEIDQSLLRSYYQNSPQLIRLIEFLMKDNELMLYIMYELNCLPLVKQITNIAGNLLSRTLLGGRSERNEYLLLHAFHQQGYLVPDKMTRFGGKDSSTASKVPLVKLELETDMPVDEEQNGEPTMLKKKTAAVATNKKSGPSYAGGLVLEPKIGFYDRFILLMDFNSLYPSIIQEYNICFTTINAPVTSNGHSITEVKEEEDTIIKLLQTDLNTAVTATEGILPTEIRKLVEARREAKRALYDTTLSSEERMQLDIKQKALKITANSMYGCLGFVHSRFYAKHLAALITAKGREILLATKELVERMGYDVVYGDTDSIMILTTAVTYEEVREIGLKIQTEINRLYKLLEIEVDGVFRCMLLLKKKKYAALTVTKTPGSAANALQYTREIKGLDIVRRDWSTLAKIAGETILDKILIPDRPVEMIVDAVHTYLKQLADSVRNNELPLENYVINKALTKNPKDYPENNKLTHVMVAMRYNEKNLGKHLRAGDTVSFVICTDGTTNAATQRGYHIEEIRQDATGTLKVDINYYLTQQILPVVSRLCDPIDGTDTGIIAEFLGVESHYKRPSHQMTVVELDPALNSGAHKYDCCASLRFVCPYSECSKEFEIRDLFRLWNKPSKELLHLTRDARALVQDKNLLKLTIANCEHCAQPFGFGTHFYFELQLRKQITELIDRFYLKEMYCDDQACNQRTRYMSGPMQLEKHVRCPVCRSGNLQLELSEHFLYQQLNFFCQIFDLEQALTRFVPLELSEKQRAERNNILRDYAELCNRLQRTVQWYLDRSSYNEFDLAYLFRKFRYSSN